jgi:hypothetical protein
MNPKVILSKVVTGTIYSKANNTGKHPNGLALSRQPVGIQSLSELKMNKICDYT